jgi:putative Mg2+ transporter-C (MgtC) family protein
LPDIAWWEILLRLGVAAALGGAIGIEREIRERQAGLRTHMLVSVGAALFTLASAYAFDDFLYSQATGITLDPTRIAAQIVTGIGFLGAGAIIRQGLSIRGLTTAATLWVVAAIGLAAGAGFYVAAVFATAVVLIALWPLRGIARRLGAHEEEGRLLVDLPPGAAPGAVLSALQTTGAHIEAYDVEDGEDGRQVSISIDLPRGMRPADVVGAVGRVDVVRGVRWG